MPLLGELLRRADLPVRGDLRCPYLCWGAKVQPFVLEYQKGMRAGQQCTFCGSLWIVGEKG